MQHDDTKVGTAIRSFQAIGHRERKPPKGGRKLMAVLLDDGTLDTGKFALREGLFGETVEMQTDDGQWQVVKDPETLDMVARGNQRFSKLIEQEGSYTAALQAAQKMQQPVAPGRPGDEGASLATGADPAVAKLPADGGSLAGGRPLASVRTNAQGVPIVDATQVEGIGKTVDVLEFSNMDKEKRKALYRALFGGEMATLSDERKLMDVFREKR